MMIATSYEGQKPQHQQIDLSKVQKWLRMASPPGLRSEKKLNKETMESKMTSKRGAGDSPDSQGHMYTNEDDFYSDNSESKPPS